MLGREGSEKAAKLLVLLRSWRKVEQRLLVRRSCYSEILEVSEHEKAVLSSLEEQLKELVNEKGRAADENGYWMISLLRIGS